MKWTQSQPGSVLFTAADAMTHLRIDDTSQADYLTLLIAAATAHAEKVMASSLLTRIITATFYSGEPLSLPRGPVQSITSVTVNGALQSAAAYQLEGYGYEDLLRFNMGTIQPYASPNPMVVVYPAGFGDTAAAVPADILQAIKCMVGVLYENRETAAAGEITAVPFIDSFLKLHSRALEVG